MRPNIQKLLCAELKRQMQSEGVFMMKIPAGGELLWQWFLDLNRSRTYHQAGPNPISHTEIVGYAHLYRWPIQPHHVAILRAMDEVWLQHAYARKPDEKEATKANMAPGRTMTPARFDAMFGR